MNSDLFFERFCKIIEKYDMFKEGDSVVAAVSGGADSVCLLSLLYKYKDIRINCVHINHGLRDSANDDRKFVEGLCEKMNIPFFCKELNIREIAEREKISEELCGRKERYAFLFEVMRKTGSKAILTAHNKNDSAESVLLHLVRGSGLQGLTGISASRGDGVYRPLLEFERSEIINYLQQNNISWVEDETNSHDKYTRNFIRLHVMPLLEKINPSVCDAITRCAGILREDNECLNEIAKNAGGIEISEEAVSVEIQALKPPSAAKRIIIAALESVGREPSHNDINALLALCEKQTGKRHRLSGVFEAVREYNRIEIRKTGAEYDFDYLLLYEKEVFIKETGHIFLLTRKRPEGSFLEIRECGGELRVRSFRQDDRFVPQGMKGHRRIRDFLLDKKIPSAKRRKIPILTADGEIVCVADMRVDTRFAPEPETDSAYIIIREEV